MDVDEKGARKSKRKKWQESWWLMVISNGVFSVLVFGYWFCVFMQVTSDGELDGVGLVWVIFGNGQPLVLFWSSWRSLDVMDFV